ncbi:hypothetical protein M422DRAFT_36938 [Sphaerobolus stellatus SS14]|uniref:Uncharacterized protein n=1 Tax=Sphaerobolus stellatus (strain SS14) TaxID=990650 RepID=A0A0C9UWG9_SPHS4|nr:hypothetical protein M422DRAFT_36938 [Sphaerobolus stellatus SS14]
MLELVRVSDTLLLAHLNPLSGTMIEATSTSSSVRIRLPSSVGMSWSIEIHPGGLADTLVLS